MKLKEQIIQLIYINATKYYPVGRLHSVIENRYTEIIHTLQELTNEGYISYIDADQIILTEKGKQFYNETVTTDTIDKATIEMDNSITKNIDVNIKRTINQAQNKNYWLAESRVLPVALWITVGGFVGIIITIGVYFLKGLIKYSGTIDSATIGTFGDFIGGFFGTLFSLATVFLVWLAYQAQKQELKALGDQGKEQTKIQALTALISTEMSHLDILNQHLIDSKDSNNIYMVGQYNSKITEIKTIINGYKKQLTDILEKAQ